MSYYEKYNAIVEKFNNSEILNFIEILRYSRMGIFGSLEDASSGDFESIINQFNFIGDLRLAIQAGDYDELFEKDIIKNQILIKTIITILDNEIVDLYEYQELIGTEKIDNELKEDFDTLRCDINNECILLINHLSHFVPEFQFKNKLEPAKLKELSVKTETEQDTRRSEKAPTNTARIKALKEFCPELWSKLSKSNKDNQQQIIHLITGVNLEDSYKYSFGSRQKEMNSKIIKGFDTLSTNLNKPI